MDSLKCKTTGKLRVRNPLNPKSYMRAKSLNTVSQSPFTKYEDKDLGGSNWQIMEGPLAMTENEAVEYMLSNGYSIVVLAWGKYYFKNPVPDYSTQEIVDQISSSNAPGMTLWLNNTKHN